LDRFRSSLSAFLKVAINANGDPEIAVL